MNEEMLNSILEGLSKFGWFLLEVLYSALWGLYMLISTAYTKINEFIIGIEIPVLPSAPKILQERIISGTIVVLIFIFILSKNIGAYRLFKLDKKKAKQNGEAKGKHTDRISERKLLSKCFFGGAIGGFLGMRMCRHKTLKKKFTVSVTIMLIIQLLLYSFVLGFFGFWLYLS